MPDGTLTLQGLYEEHFQFVWKSLRRLGVPEADAPDAVQDVFIVVHRKLAEFEGRSKVTTWLFGIAMRVARDRQKLAYTRRKVDDEDAVAAFVDERADLFADAERRQGLELLEAILSTMPLEQRAVFSLFELDGLTGEAIAELLEVPLGTVYSRLRLAREVFQKCVTRLRARGDHPGSGHSGAGHSGAGHSGAGHCGAGHSGAGRPRPPPPAPPRQSGIRELTPNDADAMKLPSRRMAAGGAL